MQMYAVCQRCFNYTISGRDPVFPRLSGNRLIKANYATRLKALQITIRGSFSQRAPFPICEADGLEWDEELVAFQGGMQWGFGILGLCF